MTTDIPAPKSRNGYLKARMWPTSEYERAPDGSAQLPAGKKLYIPKYILRFAGQPILYHYTTVEGLFGIINENGVWAGHVRYMNDVEEIRHGQELATDTLQRLALKAKFGAFRNVLSQAAEILAQARLPEYYVASFSRVGDDLSQWRAYGKGRGISIGFNFSAPDSYLHFYLPVIAIYRRREKIGTILFIVEKFLKEFRKDLDFYHGTLPIHSLKEYPESLAQRFQFEFVRFKHESFESEQEVRQVISSEEEARYRPRKHRPRGNVIVPYYKTSDLIWRNQDRTDIEPARIPISSITIGPMKEQELCSRSICDFLRFHGYDPAIVKNSRLPYRVD